ncbi:hypothetical protein DPMN_052128 [Dreissena polymorpha]|uniref:Uncharacterized protein n=1 Tax=Dreissena polymorpha TaxID=45954 RepID=A0A9D4CJ47_DREPO|nr:hypothetical protein DPMN_052128 [Dreissena polymorpha]
MAKAKANSKRVTDSTMELAETLSKRRRQGKSVTDSGSSGAAPRPGPSSAEAVPGTCTHAIESPLGHVLS